VTGHRIGRRPDQPDRLHDPARDHALLIALARRLRDAGCFARCDRQYARRLALLVPAFAACFAALLAASPGPAWAVLIVATGFVSVQLGIVSHDAGHRAVDRRRGWNDLWGHAGMTLACGLSFSHWRIVHDAHHRHSQDELLDPDMQYAVAFSVHARGAAEKRGVARALRPFQHLYFWPLGALYSWSLRCDSIARLFRDPAHTRVDRWVLPGHYALWLIGPALIVGPAAAIASYALVSTVIGLYLVAIFAPNHMGMPSRRAGERWSYLEQQIVTSRDLTVGPVLSIVLGGLEHQIEHHLFPNIGQPRLAAARAIVTAFCAEHGLPHREVGFLAAHRAVVGQLQAMARLPVPATYPREEEEGRS
jgi:fatty acid desaturase